MSTPLQSKQAALNEVQKNLDRYSQAANHLRALAALNVLSQDEVASLCHIAGKVMLGAWQIDGQVSALKQEVDALTPPPEKEPEPTHDLTTDPLDALPEDDGEDNSNKPH